MQVREDGATSSGSRLASSQPVPLAFSSSTTQNGGLIFLGCRSRRSSGLVILLALSCLSSVRL
jgi:hypothetical protein